MAFTQLMRGLLFDIEPTDPGVLALVATALVLTALVASHLPARRAARVDPIVALNHEWRAGASTLPPAVDFPCATGA